MSPATSRGDTPGHERGLVDEILDPALASAVLEIEQHLASGGWDQPARLYALVPTAELVDKEPALAHAMGLDESAAAGSLTPVEQEPLGEDADLERSLESISWPPGVSGCAAVVERLVLPPDAEAAVLDDPEGAATYARQHPDRQEVRIVAGATRAGATYCALRLRGADDQSVLTGAELVPGLLELLRDTLVDHTPDDPDHEPDHEHDPEPDHEHDHDRDDSEEPRGRDARREDAS
jgi:hypothetical protein